MTKMNSKTLTLSSLALLAQTAPVLAGNVQNPAAQQQDLNVASVNAVRASWIKVHPMCKDRSFPFVAAPVTLNESPTTTALFAELDRLAGVQG